MSQKELEKGYIAITSVIVITFLLISIATSLGFAGFSARFDILDSESKEISSALAVSCLNKAILNLSQNLFYSPENEIVPVGKENCAIISVSNSGGNKIIKTQGIFNKSFTNLKITVDNSSFEITGLQECPNFDASC